LFHLLYRVSDPGVGSIILFWEHDGFRRRPEAHAVCLFACLCPASTFVGLISAAMAANLESPHSRGLWIATGVVALPGILTILLVTIGHAL
jgi:hypothetical protein